MEKINVKKLYKVKSSLIPYYTFLFKQRLIQCLTIIFICSTLLYIGACSGGGNNNGAENGDLAGEGDCTDGVDNDGDTEVDCEDIDCILDPACPGCEEIVAILCNRADECGFVLEDECIADYVFNDLGFDCSEFLTGPFTDECMDDIDNFDCDSFGNDELPESCGSEFVTPQGIQVPPGACEDLFLAECSRVVECDSLTFDVCLLGLLFFTEEVAGIDCSKVSGSETLEQCVEDIDDFDCDLIEDAIVPDSCVDVLVEDSSSQLECLDGECTFFVIDPLCPENNCGLFPGFLTTSFGSVANADFNCQYYADYFSLLGTYLAWISDSNTSPNDRFNKATVPYVNVKGEKLADSYADLTDGTLNAVILDQEGEWAWWASPWTGTNSDGTPTGFNCRDWTSANSADLGTQGYLFGVNSDGSSGWSNNFNTPTNCNFLGNLICVEQ